MSMTTFIPIQPNNNSTVSFLANDPYIDKFWLPILGPTATLLLHELMGKALVSPDAFTSSIRELSCIIGVGNREGSASPIAKNLKRLCDFGLISKYNDYYYVPTNIEMMGEDKLRKLSYTLQSEHKKWIYCLNQDTLATQRQKARFLFASLTLKSIGTNEIIRALSRSGLHPSIIGETTQNLLEVQLTA